MESVSLLKCGGRCLAQWRDRFAMPAQAGSQFSPSQLSQLSKPSRKLSRRSIQGRRACRGVLACSVGNAVVAPDSNADLLGTSAASRHWSYDNFVGGFGGGTDEYKGHWGVWTHYDTGGKILKQFRGKRLWLVKENGDKVIQRNLHDVELGPGRLWVEEEGMWLKDWELTKAECSQPNGMVHPFHKDHLVVIAFDKHNKIGVLKDLSEELPQKSLEFSYKDGDWHSSLLPTYVDNILVRYGFVREYYQGYPPEEPGPEPGDLQETLNGRRLSRARLIQWPQLGAKGQMALYEVQDPKPWAPSDDPETLTQIKLADGGWIWVPTSIPVGSNTGRPFWICTAKAMTDGSIRRMMLQYENLLVKSALLEEFQPS